MACIRNSISSIPSPGFIQGQAIIMRWVCMRVRVCVCVCVCVCPSVGVYASLCVYLYGSCVVCICIYRECDDNRDKGWLVTSFPILEFCFIYDIHSFKQYM